VRDSSNLDRRLRHSEPRPPWVKIRLLITDERSCILFTIISGLVGLSFDRTHPAKPWGIRSLLQALKSIGTVAVYVAMLIAILALWNNNAPQFIYVAF